LKGRIPIERIGKCPTNPKKRRETARVNDAREAILLSIRKRMFSHTYGHPLKLLLGDREDNIAIALNHPNENSIFKK
jgi:hypothetical protein